MFSTGAGTGETGTGIGARSACKVLFCGHGMQDPKLVPLERREHQVGLDRVGLGHRLLRLVERGLRQP